MTEVQQTQSIANLTVLDLSQDSFVQEEIPCLLQHADQCVGITLFRMMRNAKTEIQSMEMAAQIYVWKKVGLHVPESLLKHVKEYAETAC